MQSILYLGDDKKLEENFTKILSAKGYFPFVCPEKGELIEYLFFDFTLREIDSKEVTVELMVKKFKEMIERIGFKLLNTIEGDKNLSKILKQHLNSGDLKRIDGLVMDEMIGSYRNDAFSIFKEIYNDSVSSDKFQKKVNKILNKQIKDLGDSLELTKFIRRAGYHGPLLIQNEFEFLGKYNVSNSFLNAGADVVASGSDLITNFDGYLSLAQKIRLSKKIIPGSC